MLIGGSFEPLACYFCARSESHQVAPVARAQPVYYLTGMKRKQHGLTGHDKISNLNLSISLSLLSPKLKLVPHSEELSSLLSVLPEDLGNIELIQSKPLIGDILGCKTTLIRTAQAYLDERKRIKALVPIREYMQRNRPPGNHLIRSLLKYFQASHSRASQGILRALGQFGSEPERRVHLNSGSPQAEFYEKVGVNIQ
jgi:hypothetical protein